MGRGRTTTGTVIACLLKLQIDYGRPIKILVDNITLEEVDGGSSSGEETGGTSAASTSSVTNFRNEKEQSHVFGMNDILLLWKITRLFDNGVECREALDAIIDRCSALQNIRQAVLQYRKVFSQHVEPRVRRVALNRGAEYLERYFLLIAFAAYLGSEAFDGFCGQGESRMTFKNWLHQRPQEELRAPLESQHGDAVLEAIVKARSGSVLGKGSILKMYFFPGQRTSSHIQIHGAPHVFKVDGYPVYSMATPTILGAKEMLAYLDDVKTPAEVYAAMKDEGYNFAYRRIPLTREREALSSDVDAIQYCIDDSAGCYLFVSHTGFGGVAYAMAIICIRTGAETNSLPKDPQPLVRMNLLCTPKEDLPSRASDEEALGMGDYRDILSLTRVLVYGPKSKADIDIVIERELKKFPDAEDEQRAYLMDMGIKALR
ncbi:hypothetical protein C1H46_002931 [Malus baccata]|uniref:Uncharacterized protein n=1 Tax=Malus baccata TaxID=106549 RepID=A0A540NKJ9_MALBA|nr:hypothetical protein C1H46_002931 [Malus baccata]